MYTNNNIGNSEIHIRIAQNNNKNTSFTYENEKQVPSNKSIKIYQTKYIINY